jgi:hypothetical protein
MQLFFSFVGKKAGEKYSWAITLAVGERVPVGWSLDFN